MPAPLNSRPPLLDDRHRPHRGSSRNTPDSTRSGCTPNRTERNRGNATTPPRPPAPDKRTGTQAMIAAENAAHEWWAAETRSNDPAFGFVDPMRSHAEEYRAWRLLLPRYCHKGSNAAPDDLEIIAEALAQKIPILATNNFTSIRIGWTNAHVRKQGWRTSDLIRLPEDALSTLERTASIPDLGLKALLAAAVSTAERPAEAVNLVSHDTRGPPCKHRARLQRGRVAGRHVEVTHTMGDAGRRSTEKRRTPRRGESAKRAETQNRDHSACRQERRLRPMELSAAQLRHTPSSAGALDP